jgi:hypothetical protein
MAALLSIVLRANAGGDARTTAGLETGATVRGDYLPAAGDGFKTSVDLYIHFIILIGSDDSLHAALTFYLQYSTWEVTST